MKKFFNTDTLLAFGLIGGLGAAAYFWWQNMQGGTGLNVMKIVPGDYSFDNAPGGTIVGDAYVPVGGANIRPLPSLLAPLTPNTNPVTS
jgi:hypothetical protein